VAGKTSINIAITATTSGLRAGLQSASVQVKSFGTSLTTAGVALGNLASAGIQEAIQGLRQLGDVIADSVKLASDFAEQSSKFDVVFKDNADAVRAWAAEYAASLGYAKQEFVPFLASVQDTLVPLGFGGDAASEVSKKIVMLATDLASFNNMDVGDVVQKLTSSLVGNTENLRQFGVVAQESQIKAELLSMGIDPKNATAMQKALAILNITLEGTADAQGDATRTSGSFANQMKAFQSQVNGLKISLGEQLLPQLTAIMPEVISLVQELAAGFKVFAAEMLPSFGDATTNAKIFAEGVRAIVPEIVSGLTLIIGQAKVLAAPFIFQAKLAVDALTLIAKAIDAMTGSNMSAGLERFSEDLAQLSSDALSSGMQNINDALSGKTAAGVREAMQKARQEALDALKKEVSVDLPPLEVDLSMDISPASEAGKNALKQIVDAQKEWQSVGERLRKSVQTPQEALQAQVAEATEAFRRGAINGTTYARVLGDLKMGFLDAAEASRLMGGSVGAATKGSAEGFSALQEGIHQSLALRDRKFNAGGADAIIGGVQKQVANNMNLMQDPQQAALAAAQRTVAQNDAQTQLFKQMLDRMRDQNAVLEDLKREFINNPPVRILGP